MKPVQWILAVCLALSFSAHGFAEETIRITTSKYLPDYSKDYKYYGLTPYIVTEAFALERIKAEWNFMPWARAKMMAQDLQRDASCCWAKRKTAWSDWPRKS